MISVQSGGFEAGVSKEQYVFSRCQEHPLENIIPPGGLGGIIPGGLGGQVYRIQVGLLTPWVWVNLQDFLGPDFL